MKAQPVFAIMVGQPAATCPPHVEITRLRTGQLNRMRYYHNPTLASYRRITEQMQRFPMTVAADCFGVCVIAWAME